MAASVTLAGRDIEFDGLKAYISEPTGTGPHPGVLVIHEIFGLNDQIRHTADRFAADGYTALVVDMFSRGNKAICIMRVMMQSILRDGRGSGFDDLQTARAYLQGLKDVDANRVGVIGFCFGGGYAMLMACRDEETRAASVFYGRAPHDLDELANACPIVGSYGERDFPGAGSGPETALKIAQKLKRLDKPFSIKVYPGAMHGFFNEERSQTYDPIAAEDAWQRTLSFFDEFIRR